MIQDKQSKTIKIEKTVSPVDKREYILDYKRNLFIKTYRSPYNIKGQALIEYEHSRTLNKIESHFLPPLKITYNNHNPIITYPLLRNFFTAKELLLEKKQFSNLQSEFKQLIRYRKQILKFLIQAATLAAYKVFQNGFFIGDLAAENIGININPNLCEVVLIDAGATPLCPMFNKTLKKYYAPIQPKGQVSLQLRKKPNLLAKSTILNKVTKCQNAIFIYSLFIGINRHLLDIKEILRRIQLAKLFSKTWYNLAKTKSTTIDVFLLVLSNEIRRYQGIGKIKPLLKSIIILALLPFMI